MVMPQNRGELATIATPDKSFECHTYLSKVKAITVTKGKVGWLWMGDGRCRREHAWA